MHTQAVTTMLFHAIGGLGIFLLGMKYLSEGMQSVASNQMRTLIGLVTNNRVVAVVVGTLFTCLVQSSSITTVMVVGLVNSSVMTLLQAIGVIFGANIGTTITGWILVLKIGKYGLPMLGLASLFFLFSGREKVRFVAMAIMGVGMVFFGLELMKDGFKPIRALPEFVAWFSVFDAGTYFGVLKCALIGCVLTFIVQSSSATLAITMGLASTGVIGFESAAALVLGENIGTTITAFLASLGTGVNAKRAAYAHITFNVLGVFWVTAVFQFYLAIIKNMAGIDPGLMVSDNGQETYPYVIQGIAMVHTGFNVTNTLLFLPFVGQLEKLLVKLFPGTEGTDEHKLTTLNIELLETPVVALEQSRKEILGMANITQEMMVLLDKAIGSEEVDEAARKKIFEYEEVLDKMQNEVSVFLTELLSSGLSSETTEEARRQFRKADEYESISDYITKILKLHLRLRNSDLKLPTEDNADLKELHNKIAGYLSMVNTSVASKDSSVLTRAKPMSDTITHEVRRIRTLHIERLSKERINPLITMIFTDMLNDYRRVKDHALNIAEAGAGVK